MAPSSKENELLTASPETAAAVPVAAGPRHEDTATGSRPQPVALEVPVTVNGAEKNFMVDTGGYATSIGADTAKAMGMALHSIKFNQIIDAGG